ncbi:hypothetical protein SEA_MOLEFICENT_18 [Microbacterium phage Moleficent]|uniref:DUF932 domain-containing protein n=1 Tax=Microbacterium phage RicoCaldo TaxID=3230836 RepID=A0AAU8EF67_9CAUD|nr:hypothetical protein SEA_MAZUN_18 [Microbacterium phage Mazun]WNM74522.1 hypothetical protein SEA_MOLEFICENT_18 [Microbacterium phage Moleficent]
MSHEISKTDKVFAVRQPTWHGLEDLLHDHPTREEAEKLVHDWQVIREPLYRQVPFINDAGEPDTLYQLVDEYELNVRSDTARELAVVPSHRVEVQPHEMWDLAELIQGQDKNVIFETAGSLREGRDVWILIKLDEPVTINGDPQGESLPYFALQNSYEPGSAFRGQATNIRIVCANTSRATDFFAEAHGTNFSFRHGSNLHERVDEIREALAGWRQSIQTWKLQKEFMLTEKVTADQMNWFVEQFIPMPDIRLKTTDRVRENVETARIELITELYGGLNKGITGTTLGLFEAASSWNEHVRAAQTPMSRFKRSILSPSDVLQQAHELAVAAASV